MRHFFLASIFSIVFSSLFAQPFYAGESIGPAQVQVKNDFFEVKNNSLEAKWLITNRIVHAESFSNKETKQIINWKQTSWFYLNLHNGISLTSNDFKIVKKPVKGLIINGPGTKQFDVSINDLLWFEKIK